MYIKGVRVRYPDLNLDDNQAAKIVAFEQQPRIPGNSRESFSPWEESDYELDEFRNFLSPEQLRLFESQRAERMAEHESRLIEQDKRQEKELLLNQEYVVWLRQVFVPGLWYDRFAMNPETSRVPIVFHIEKEKIAFLRAEYANFLARTRHGAIVRHYRQSRRLEPNKLKIALLYQEQLALIPNFDRFMKDVDEPTLAIGTFVIERYRFYAEKAAEYFKQKEAENKKRYAELRTQFIGEPEIRGWHTTIMPAYKWSEEQYWLMSLMLMSDPGKNL